MSRQPIYELLQIGSLDWDASSAADISGDGRVVGYFRAEDAPEQMGNDQIFLWDKGTIVNLTDLGAEGSVLFDLNGAVVVTRAGGASAAYRPESGTFEPYDWNFPTVVPPSGFALATVNTVNRHGEAVGTLYPKAKARAKGARGFVLTDSNVIVLPIAPGGDAGVGWWINDRGQVIGGPPREEEDEGVVLWDGRAFLYDLRSNETTDLGTLPGFDNSMAYGINDAGEVVGETWRWGSDGLFDGRAVIFDPSSKTVSDLNDLIPSNSGWELSVAYDINSAGQIVGSGRLSNTQQAFLLQPVPQLDAPQLDLTGLFPTAFDLTDGSPATGGWSHVEVVDDGSQTAADIAAWMGSETATTDLTTWRWQVNTYRAYRMDAPSGSTDLTISIDQFADGPPIALPSGSKLSGEMVALEVFAERWADLLGVTAERAGIIGPGVSFRAGSWRITAAHEATLFVASHRWLIRVTATGPGDPPQDTVKLVMEMVLARAEQTLYPGEV